MIEAAAELPDPASGRGRRALGGLSVGLAGLLEERRSMGLPDRASGNHAGLQARSEADPCHDVARRTPSLLLCVSAIFQVLWPVHI